jgi:hypothetical protein
MFSEELYRSICETFRNRSIVITAIKRLELMLHIREFTDSYFGLSAIITEIIPGLSQPLQRNSETWVPDSFQVIINRQFMFYL